MAYVYDRFAYEGPIFLVQLSLSYPSLHTKVTSALEGLRVSLEIAVWAYVNFGNILQIKNCFTKDLKVSC